MEIALGNHLKFLKNVSIFRHLSEDALLELAQRVEPVSWDKDAVLFRKGDSGDAMYLIQSGWVKIVTQDASGNELVLNHCGPGEAVGDMALIDGEPRSATVVALLPGRALKLGRTALLDILQRQPALAMDILHGLSARLRLATTYIEKAIEWSHRVAQGDYAFMEQLGNEHKTIVTMSRSDEARVGEFLSAFFRMVEGVREREEALRKEVYQLKIEIDEARRQREVEEISKTDFFKNLKSVTQRLRRSREDEQQGS